jgi:PH (Pleckstrin Homology) domain-containing protein
MHRFAAAPWSLSLKLMSFSSLLILVAVPWTIDQTMPDIEPLIWVRRFVWAVCALVGLISLLFVVREYEIGGGELVVRRLFWSTRIDIRGLSGVRHDPAALRGSWRLFGNGGLFSFSGLFYNAQLGRYRLFGTNLRHAVILLLPRRAVVITPENPQAFAAVAPSA